MRIVVLGITALIVSALPASAQTSRASHGPWTLTPAMVMCTDLPVTTMPAPRLTVAGVHSPDDRFAVASGTLIIKRVADDGLTVGQRYFTARVRDPKGFPRPGEGFGDVRVTGIITVKALDEVNAMADVDMPCDAIEPGDFVEPFVDVALPAEAGAMQPPDFSDRGSVLFGVDNRTAFGFGDTLSIDRGTLHGVVPGARYAIYRDKRNGMPLVYIGEAVVMATGEQTSKVVVTKAVDAIASGDLAVPRRSN